MPPAATVIRRGTKRSLHWDGNSIGDHYGTVTPTSNPQTPSRRSLKYTSKPPLHHPSKKQAHHVIISRAPVVRRLLDTAKSEVTAEIKDKEADFSDAGFLRPVGGVEVGMRDADWVG